MSKRMKVQVMGLDFGTASGWDDVDGHAIQFYDFEPHSGSPMADGDLYVDFETGAIVVMDPEDGDELDNWDAVTILKWHKENGY